MSSKNMNSDPATARHGQRHRGGRGKSSGIREFMKSCVDPSGFAIEPASMLEELSRPSPSGSGRPLSTLPPYSRYKHNPGTKGYQVGNRVYDKRHGNGKQSPLQEVLGRQQEEKILHSRPTTPALKKPRQKQKKASPLQFHALMEKSRESVREDEKRKKKEISNDADDLLGLDTDEMQEEPQKIDEFNERIPRKNRSRPNSAAAESTKQPKIVHPGQLVANKRLIEHDEFAECAEYSACSGSPKMSKFDCEQRETQKSSPEATKDVIEVYDEPGTHKKMGQEARDLVNSIEKEPANDGSLFGFIARKSIETVKTMANSFMTGPNSSFSGEKKRRKVERSENSSIRSRKRTRQSFATKSKRGTPIAIGASIHQSRQAPSTETQTPPSDWAHKQMVASTARNTRSATRNRFNKEQEEIMIEDSDDDELDGQDENAEEAIETNPIPIRRIAIGPHVSRKGCVVLIARKGLLQINFERKRHGRNTRHSETCFVEINLEKDIQQMRYYLAPPDVDQSAEHLSFMAFTTGPVATKEVQKAGKQYDPGSAEQINRFVVIEFKTTTRLEELIETMRTLPCMRGFLAKDAAIDGLTAKDFCESLLQDTETFLYEESPVTRNGKKRKSRERFAPKFLEEKDDDDILLTYPFAGDKKAIEEAANGLKELSQFATRPTPNEATDANGNQSDGDENVGGGRAHYLMISAGDCRRLAPGIFLNDTLIDFFMAWMSRNESDQATSPLHYFSTHFYSSLFKEGPGGVRRWTEKKGIDVFKKRFIFVPVNKSFHWSLAIIVNPGAIEKHIEWIKARNDKGDNDKTFLHDLESYGDYPFPMILFFDSLKCHPRKTVANKLRQWLNAEWKRIKGDDLNDPFTESSIRPVVPKVPDQHNGYDCGVFTCRYAYGITQLKDKVFSYSELGVGKNKPIGCEFFRKHRTFEFNDDDIDRLRQEMLTLIERLSSIYIPWKMEQDRLAKERRRAAKRAKTQAATESDGNRDDSDQKADEDRSEKETVVQTSEPKSLSTPAKLVGESNVPNSSQSMAESPDEIQIVGVKRDVTKNFPHFRSSAKQMLNHSPDQEDSVQVGDGSSDEDEDRKSHEHNEESEQFADGGELKGVIKNLQKRHGKEKGARQTPRSSKRNQGQPFSLSRVSQKADNIGFKAKEATEKAENDAYSSSKGSTSKISKDESINLAAIDEQDEQDNKGSSKQEEDDDDEVVIVDDDSEGVRRTPGLHAEPHECDPKPDAKAEPSSSVTNDEVRVSDDGNQSQTKELPPGSKTISISAHDVIDVDEEPEATQSDNASQAVCSSSDDSNCEADNGRNYTKVYGYTLDREHASESNPLNVDEEPSHGNESAVYFDAKEEEERGRESSPEAMDEDRNGHDPTVAVSRRKKNDDADGVHRTANAISLLDLTGGDNIVEHKLYDV